MCDIHASIFMGVRGMAVKSSGLKIPLATDFSRIFLHTPAANYTRTI